MRSEGSWDMSGNFTSTIQPRMHTDKHGDPTGVTAGASPAVRHGKNIRYDCVMEEKASIRGNQCASVAENIYWRLAGIAYNALFYFVRSLSACNVVHGVTNLALGIYVLQTGNCISGNAGPASDFFVNYRLCRCNYKRLCRSGVIVLAIFSASIDPLLEHS